MLIGPWVEEERVLTGWHSIAVAIVALLLSSYLYAAGNGPPPIPKYADIPIGEIGNADVASFADGYLAWISARPIAGAPDHPCWPWELVRRRWNPATGAHDERALGLGGEVHAQAPVAGGIFALTSTGCQSGNHSQLVFAGNDGRLLVSNEDISGGEYVNRLLPLGADAAIVYGTDRKTRHAAIVTVRIVDGALQVKRQALLDTPFKRDYALVVLDAGRLLLAGGSNDQYIGCLECRADTWFLDLVADRWTSGPRLLEERSSADATRLPDGSVLVSGGWTHKAPWGYGPSATTEILRPGSDHFEPGPPMPSGNSEHHGYWLPGAEGKTLLLVNGTSSAVPAFDVETRTWYVAASLPSGSQGAGCGFLPFTYDGARYAWMLMVSEGQMAGGCGMNDGAQLSLVRSYGKPAGAPPPVELLRTQGTEPAFVPATASQPALLIGGTAHVGMNSYLPTRAVDAVDRDGRLYAWPDLLTPRQDARAFRIGDGVLVIGGSRGLMEALKGNPDKSPLPSEWRSANGKAPWRLVDGIAFDEAAAVGQLSDGNLLTVDALGKVEELAFTDTDGTLSVHRQAWATLNETRRSVNDNRVAVRELRDGRVIVAGGKIQAARIARLVEHVSEPDAPDEYVGYGPEFDATNYEIYDPAAKVWRVSADSERPGGRVTILADGRVLREVTWSEGEGNAQAWHWDIEASSPNGAAWRTLAADELPSMLADAERRLFTLDDELYAIGRSLQPIPNEASLPLLQRWDAKSGRWVDIWRGTHPYELGRAGRLLLLSRGGERIVLPLELH